LREGGPTSPLEAIEFTTPLSKVVFEITEEFDTRFDMVQQVALRGARTVIKNVPWP
jgi:hypothetical protein